MENPTTFSTVSLQTQTPILCYKQTAVEPRCGDEWGIPSVPKEVSRDPGRLILAARPFRLPAFAVPLRQSYSHCAVFLGPLPGHGFSTQNSYPEPLPTGEHPLSPV